MDTRTQLGTGAVLAVFGGVGMVVGHTFGLAQIDRPWGFMLGFLVGVCAGAGAALSVAGLLKRKNEATLG